MSTNGTTSGTGITWAVGRPATTTSVILYAFAAQAANSADRIARQPACCSGALLAVAGKTLTLQTRERKTVKIDDTLAVLKQQIGVLATGAPFTAEGSPYNPVGALQATSIY